MFRFTSSRLREKHGSPLAPVLKNAEASANVLREAENPGEEEFPHRW